MNVKVMKLKDLRPAPYNPRETLKPGDNEYESLKNSLGKFGLVSPLIMNAATGFLVSGHQRLNALKAAGVEEAEVVLIDITPDREKLLNVALNKIDGEWDYDKLKDVFQELEADDIQFTGFSQDELMNLFDDGITDFDSDEEEQRDDEMETGAEEKAETEKPATLKEFNIFLSFPDKESAEKWLEEREIDTRYEKTNHNITIRMMGVDYDTGN